MQPPPSSADSHRRSHVKAACVVLFLGTVLLFSRALTCGFVNFDDPFYVTDNPHVQAGITAEGIKWAFLGANDYWRPLAWLSHMVDWQLFGNDASGHHLTSVFWHAANAVLAFLVFLRLAGGFWRSLFAAALFAWHPLRVESVVWITERKDVMSLSFMLLAVLSYSRYAGARSAGRRAWKDYLMVVLWFVAGLMSKPMIVTLPVLLLLLDYWPLRRATSLAEWRALIIEKLPLLAISAAVSIATVVMQQATGAFVLGYSLVDRAGNAIVSVARYLGMFVWPAGLSAIYSHPGGWPVVTTLASLALIVGIGALAWWQRDARPWIAVGLAWFLVSLLPVIGLFQVGYQAMADRFTYVPVLGVELALLWSVPALAVRSVRVAAGCIAVLVLGAFAWATWRQEIVWKDSVTLFSRAVAADESSDIAHDHLASAYVADGNFDGAAIHAKRALELNPRNDRGYVILAGIAERAGRMDEAAAQYREALKVRPDDANVKCQLGLVEISLGKFEEARGLMAGAIREDPRIARQTLMLGNLAVTKGDTKSAEFLYGLLLEDDPDDARAHSGLGMLAMARNDPAAAIEHLKAAVVKLPDDAELHLAIAKCAEALGRRDEAGAALARAVETGAREPGILADAADIYARRREVPEAIRVFRQSLALDPGNARAHAALGYLLVFSGDREGGIAEWKRALELDPEIPGLRDRLKQAGR